MQTKDFCEEGIDFPTDKYENSNERTKTRFIIKSEMERRPTVREMTSKDEGQEDDPCINTSLCHSLVLEEDHLCLSLIFPTR